MNLQEIHSLTGEEPQPVKVTEIEAELAELWRKAAQEPGGGHAVTRSCLFTLFVYAEGETEGAAAVDIAGEIMLRSPCRAIVLLADPEAAASKVEAWISARYRLGGGGEKQVCCEQVVIRGGSENLAAMISATMPLAEPDLPFQVWWRTRRFEPATEFEPLFRIADRILLDSSRFADPAAELSHLARRIAGQPGPHKTIFGDISWARLTPWRELMAQAFDPPDIRPYLAKITEVQLEWLESWLGEGACQSQALLIAGWLATRLGWHFESRSSNDQRQQIIRFASSTNPVTVTLGPRLHDQQNAGCFSVGIRTAEPRGAKFEVIERSVGSCVETRAEIPGHAPMHRVVRFENQNEVPLVNQEMRFSYRNLVFEDAIAMVAKMTGASEGI
jgi:glucose-6-phosphate dehydrogenase assembly protein OpcA